MRSALLRALPDANRRDQPLEAIAGTVPPLWTEFEGCRFAPRCKLAMPQCANTRPELIERNGQHQVRCLLYAPGAAAPMRAEAAAHGAARRCRGRSGAGGAAAAGAAI